jgi:DNA/RNA-binding domain of Phe-tRNA-synthetase-like protein
MAREDRRVLEVTKAFTAAYPGASIGTLVLRNVTNQESSAGLDQRKEQLEQEIRNRFEGYSRQDLLEIGPLQSYSAYYKRFKKTYHVLLQLESVAFRGKGIPRANSLVEAMFMSELKNLLLTAGHDLSSLKLPVRVGVSGGHEQYVCMNGRDQILAQGDMMMEDGEGVISSVLYGPDSRTKIGPDTRSVLYVVYAPAGVERTLIAEHLEDITRNVATFSADMQVESLKVLP